MRKFQHVASSTEFRWYWLPLPVATPALFRLSELPTFAFFKRNVGTANMENKGNANYFKYNFSKRLHL
jgi:hypothetical protein